MYHSPSPCPKCKSGLLRRTAHEGNQSERAEPFREIGNATEFECDSCGYIKLYTKNRIYESQR